MSQASDDSHLDNAATSDSDGANEEYFGPSKSQLKREHHDLEQLGRTIAALSASQVRSMPMSDSTIDAILQAQGMKMTAQKRQFKFIRKLLTREDTAPVLIALERINHESARAVRQLHQLERWRDALLNDDQKAFEDIANTYTNVDRQYLLQLVRNAKKERTREQPAKSYRLIYQYLKELAMG